MFDLKCHLYKNPIYGDSETNTQKKKLTQKEGTHWLYGSLKTVRHQKFILDCIFSKKVGIVKNIDSNVAQTTHSESIIS
jgi:hypothetical protein